MCFVICYYYYLIVVFSDANPPSQKPTSCRLYISAIGHAVLLISASANEKPISVYHKHTNSHTHTHSHTHTQTHTHTLLVRAHQRPIFLSQGTLISESIQLQLIVLRSDEHTSEVQ